MSQIFGDAFVGGTRQSAATGRRGAQTGFWRGHQPKGTFLALVRHQIESHDDGSGEGDAGEEGGEELAGGEAGAFAVVESG